MRSRVLSCYHRSDYDLIEYINILMINKYNLTRIRVINSETNSIYWRLRGHNINSINNILLPTFVSPIVTITPSPKISYYLNKFIAPLRI